MTQAQMRKRFFCGFVFPLFTGIVYWGLILWQIPTFKDATRWLQNNPVGSVFQVVFFPMTCGILAATLPNESFSKAFQEGRRFYLPLLAVLFFIGFGFIWRDSLSALNDRVIEPSEFKTAQMRRMFLDEEKKLRMPPSQRDSEKDCKDATECYIAFTKNQFPGQQITLRNHCGIVAWWGRVLTSLGVACLAIMLWYILVLAFSKTRVTPLAFQGMLLAFSFFIAWFPLRMYSEWYVNFEMLDLSRYMPIYYGGIVAFIFCGLLFLLKTKSVVYNALVGGIAGTTAVISILAKITPNAFGHVASIVKGFDFWSFVSLEVVLFLAFLACLSVFMGGKSSDET